MDFTYTVAQHPGSTDKEQHWIRERRVDAAAVEGNHLKASSIYKMLARKATEHLAKTTLYNKRSIAERGQASTVCVAKTSMC